MPVTAALLNSLSWEAWLSIGVVMVCVVLLALNRYSPDIVLAAGVTLLLVGGVITPQEALSGLANEGMVTVGIMYVVVSGLLETGAVAWLADNLFGNERSPARACLRLTVPVVALSGFLNNTPVVAIFIPAVKAWARRNRLPLSRLMIPLSYASIAGGTCTLIGTSTNLVVNGLLRKETDLPGLRFFEIAWVGVPVALLVVLYLVLFGRWLLPDRRPTLNQNRDLREYTLEMVVEPDSPMIGKSIEQAGLRQLPDMYLMEIERDARILPAVSPEEILQGGDRLVFVGAVDSVLDVRRFRGLRPATSQILKLDHSRSDRCLVEAVVSNSSPLIGKTVRAGGFRTRYHAVIIAIARNGHRLRGKIGDVSVRPGDTLLLEAHRSFVDSQRNSRDFLLVSPISDSRPPRHDRAAVAAAIAVAMVVSVVVGWFSMLEAALLASGLMIITRCTTGGIARRSVDWQVLLVIAASFAIGIALQRSGAAAGLAHGLLGLSAGSPMLALALVFLVTALFTAFATNNAAAVIMFPIARDAAAQVGANFMPFVIVIMIAASASFATPIGYQTNLMVYSPGGYCFSDYIKAGLPLTILIGILTLFIVPVVWPL